MKPFAAEITLIAALTLLLWLAIGLLLQQRRDNLLSAAEQNTANLARAFEENTNHSIDAADQTLLFLRAIYIRDPARFSFSGWNESVRNSDGLILQVGVIGRDGMLLSSNLLEQQTRMDLSDREHFRVHRDAGGDALFISKPLIGRESGRWSMQMTRKIMTRDGAFDGVMVASVDPFVMSRVYASVNIGRGFVALAGSDGIARGGAAGAHAMIGTDLRGSPLFGAAQTADHGTLHFQDNDGAPLIASFRRLPRYGLFIAVALDRRDVLASYERGRALFLGGGALITTPILLAGFLMIRDKTRRRAAEERFLYLAHHDPLTGLANRTLFAERMARTIAFARRHGASFQVLVLDLDHFKLVNDTWGHTVGDLLLVEVAERLRATLCADDTVARFGGDEFAVLQGVETTPDASGGLARRLIEALSKPCVIQGHKLSIGVSIGAAVFPRDGTNGQELLKGADIALYAAKENGRGVFRFFESEMDERVQIRVRLEHDLREAIARGELAVHYQPICDAASRRPVAYEALVRWRHPEQGPISPAVFIPIAEETGQIGKLGEFVLRTACRQATLWPEKIGLTVNFSPVQLFDIGFERTVLDVLDETGLNPRRLGLEITEGVLIREGEAVPAALRLLRRHGLRILLDDFGTGHAGLSYLLRFRFDCIKLDRSFVTRMVDDEAARAVIRATLVLSDDLDLDVVAEGIETEEQLALLRDLGCRKVQGYLLGKPQPMPEEIQVMKGAAVSSV